MFKRSGFLGSRPAIALALLTATWGCTGVVTPEEEGDPTGTSTAGKRGGNAGRGPVAGSGGAVACGATTADLPAARVWRLTHDQYRAAIAQLVPGADLTVTKDFLRDETLGEFEGGAKTLRVSAVRAEQYQRAAAAFGEQAGKQAATIAPCASGQAAAACRSSFVTAFASRAFRRDPSDEELSGFERVYDEGATTSGHAGGVAAVVETALQSSSFLFRTELGGQARDGQVTLTGPELATSLAFTLTDAPPDERMLGLGRSNALADNAVLEREARTLLATDRGRARFADFVKQWLDVAHLEELDKSEGGFKEFGTTWAPRLEREVELFVREVLAGDRRLSTLLLAPWTFADAPLATLYGSSGAPASGHGKVTLDPKQRAGVLTTAGFLAVHAIDGASHPIKRGLFVNERLLCRVPPPPPPEAGTPPPPSSDLTTRERLERHKTSPSCASCHRIIDPPGFAFEVYDGVGRHRDKEGNRAIDASGKFDLTDEGSPISFDGPVAMLKQLAGSKPVDACFTRMGHRFFLGAHEAEPEGCLVRGLSDRFTSSGGDLSDLAIAIVTSRAFTHRRAP